MKTLSKKIESKKLTFAKETLKALTDEQLRGIVTGGDGANSAVLCG
jgi:hypothetical protein